MVQDPLDNLFKNPYPGQSLREIADRKDLTDSEKLKIIRGEKKNLMLKVDLPHLYGFKWYPWAAKFRDSTNQINLLCAANQISKSSTAIRKCILWATDQKIWPSLWRQAPVQFWYLYPTQKQVNAEFEVKWKQFLPKGEMKNDPYYGWKEEYKRGDVVAIHFNSGVHVYFKTYSQDVEALQTGTCDAIFCDEELPIDYFDELMLRISASDGYFHMVFTATIGQEEWRLAMDPTDDEVAEGKEFLPQAFKQTVSLYDAMYYEDGSESHWTLEKIKKVEARCSTHQEVLKRVYGKFIVLEGRKYPTFDLKRHMKAKHEIPQNWLCYVGIDVGAGNDAAEAANKKAHKSAICFVLVRPDYRAGRVFLGWRGDDVRTTAGDVFSKYLEMKNTVKQPIVGRRYDWASADFGTIAQRNQEPFEKADKNHEKGEEVINTLFKNDMLFIYEDPELSKLAGELGSVKKEGLKKNKKDDFSDALRYAVSTIPWDWSFLSNQKSEYQDEKPEEPLTELQKEINARRKGFEDEQQEEAQRIEDEFDEWNDAYG